MERILSVKGNIVVGKRLFMILKMGVRGQSKKLEIEEIESEGRNGIKDCVIVIYLFVDELVIE